VWSSRVRSKFSGGVVGCQKGESAVASAVDGHEEGPRDAAAGTGVLADDVHREIASLRDALFVRGSQPERHLIERPIRAVKRRTRLLAP
jgi:hypothetical protein